MNDVFSLGGMAPWKILSFGGTRAFNKELLQSVFIQEMLRRGVLINSSHNICYAHQRKDYDIVEHSYNVVLRNIREAIDTKNLKACLDGPEIKPIFEVR